MQIHCRKCGALFDVPKGSKRNLCDRCLVAQVTAPKRKPTES